MKKQAAVSILALAIGLSLAACSKDNGNNDGANNAGTTNTGNNSQLEEPAKAGAEQPTNTDMEKKKAYNAAKMAEDKVNTLFAKAAAEDGTPLLDPVTGTKEKAKELLDRYYDGALTDKILAHYITDKKSGDNIVVNKEPFFSASILATKSIEDVTAEGNKDAFTFTTQDNGVFTAKWDEGKQKYIVSNYEKK